MASQQTFLEKCYKGKHGKVAIAQFPNLPIVVWLVSLLFTHVFANGTLHNLFEIISFGTLFTWAWMELFSGANYIRRSLGLIVLVAVVYNRI